MRQRTPPATHAGVRVPERGRPGGTHPPQHEPQVCAVALLLLLGRGLLRLAAQVHHGRVEGEHALLQLLRLHLVPKLAQYLRLAFHHPVHLATGNEPEEHGLHHNEEQHVRQAHDGVHREGRLGRLGGPGPGRGRRACHVPFSFPGRGRDKQKGMPNVIHAVRNAPGAPAQVLALFAVAALLVVFEMLLFFRIIVPQVTGSLGGMLDGLGGAMALPPVARRTAAAVLGVLHTREQEHVRFTNRAALVSGCLVVGLAVLLCLLVVGLSRSIREGPKKPVVLDVLFTLGLLMAFQVVFCAGRGGRPAAWGRPPRPDPTTLASGGSTPGTPSRCSTSPRCTTRTARPARTSRDARRRCWTPTWTCARSRASACSVPCRRSWNATWTPTWNAASARGCWH